MPNYKTIPLSAPPWAAWRTWHTTVPVMYHKTFLSLAKLAFLSLRTTEAGKLRECRRASSPGGHPGMRESQTNPLGSDFPSKFLFHFSPGNFLPLPHPPAVSCRLHHHLVILHTSYSKRGKKKTLTSNIDNKDISDNRKEHWVFIFSSIFNPLKIIY